MTDLAVEFETVFEPRPEILLQAKIQFAKTGLFNAIQDLQKHGKVERQNIYQKIK